MRDRQRATAIAAVLAILALAAPVLAQDGSSSRRTRVALGPQAEPSYPGADTISIRPFVDVARADGDAPFAFEAPDESFGFSLLTLDRLTIGPVVGFEGSRSRRDVGGALPKVGSTVELGGFAQYQLAHAVRLRAEVRQGIGGHRGLVADIGADYVARDRDRWLFSVGPRLTIADDRYTRTYYGVSPTGATASGLRAFDARGGLQAVGVTAGIVRQLTPRWGVFGYAKYDRLVRDPARSPIVDVYGSKNQASAGLALSYTFGSGVGR